MIVPQPRSTIGIIRDTTYLGAMTACAAGGLGVTLCKSYLEKYAELYFGEYGARPVIRAGEVLESTSLSSIEIIESILTKSVQATDRWFERVGWNVNGELLRRLKHITTPEVYETAALVANFLGNLNSQGTIAQVVKGLKLLSNVHSLENMQVDSIEVKKSLPPIGLVEKWEFGFLCAVAACGWKVLRLIGMSTANDNRTAVKELAGVGEVIVWEDNSSVCRPAHYVGVQHERKLIVVSLRGTMQPQDIITDLVCEQDEFTCLYSESGEKITGKAHKGFLRAAQALSEELDETILKALEANKGYRLFITGHSLGAGVASLLTLLWAQDSRFKGSGLYCTAYGAPCTLSKHLALAPFTKSYVEAVTLDDDFVSRLSLGSVTELSKKALLLSRVDDDDISTHQQIVEQVHEDVEQMKLLPGGTVWHLPSYRVKCSTFFARIKLSPNMFSVHLPNRYLDEIRKLKSAIYQLEGYQQ